MKPLVPAKKHQKEGARIIHEVFDGRALLADEMGLGKTFQALMVACKRKEARPIIIVCPAGLKLNWCQELKDHFGVIPTILEGKVPDYSFLDSGIYIISYNVLAKWRKFIRKLRPQFLIVDEVHYIKSRDAKRTKYVRKLARKIPNAIFLGGTPMTKSPADLWTICNMLQPDLYPNFFEFAQEFTKAKRRWYGWDFSGGKNLKRLNKRLTNDLMIRRLKSDVLDLPKKSVYVVPLQISNRKEYEFAESDLISWIATFDKLKAKRAAQVEQLVRFGYLKRLVARLKMESILEWVDNFLQSSNEKIILFAIHKAIVFELKQKYRDISVVIDGSKSGKEKKKAEDIFNNDKWCRILIANIEAGGVGLNFQKACCTTAHVELAFVPYLHDQAMGRIDRIGQTKPMSNYFLVAHNTIEEDLCSIIQERNQMISKVMDGSGSVNKIDIFDLLEKKLQKRRRSK